MNKFQMIEKANEFDPEFAKHVASSLELLDQAQAREERTVEALVAAYRNAEHQCLTSEDLQFGHRSGVRDVAVRLGLYDKFIDAMGGS